VSSTRSEPGRDRTWIFIIVLLPLVGSIAYLAAELVPDLFGTRTGRNVTAGAKRMIDPGKAHREAERQFEISSTPHNRQILAEACIQMGAHAEAASHYRALLTGSDQYEPKFMRGLATAQFMVGDYAGALTTLDALRQNNPDYQSGDAHLLYARALEAMDRHDDAIGEYRALSAYYPGEEPRGRLMQLLQRLGREPEAALVSEEILRSERLAPKHYVRSNRQWIDEAKRRRTA
jgi:hypothetical protein